MFTEELQKVLTSLGGKGTKERKRFYRYTTHSKRVYTKTNSMTMVLSRKDKEAKLISRREDMQITSVREIAKLRSDLKPED